MVNTVENDVLGYELALRFLDEEGDTRTAAAIRGNGPPPYLEGNLLAKYARYLMVLNTVMARRAPGDGTHFNQLADVFLGPEYGLMDKVNWVRGLFATFNAVYPQLLDVDLATQAATLEVPVYFTVGRHGR